MMLAVIAAATTGTPLPGADTTEPVNVLFQSAEDGLADTIKPRLEKLAADYSRVNTIDDEEEPLSFLDDRIEKAIVSTNAKVFVFDPIQAFLGGKSLNNASAVRPMMRHLAGVAKRTGCAIIILGHLNKSGLKALYRGLGSIDVSAAARSILTVGSLGDDLSVAVHSKSNLFTKGTSQAFSLDPVEGFTWDGECEITLEELFSNKKVKKPAKPSATDLRETQLDKAQKFIQSTLADNDNSMAACEIESLANKNGIAKKTLQRAKEALGVTSVKNSDKWFWELPISEVREESQDSQDSQGCQDSHLET
jgi:hypothetical protein